MNEIEEEEYRITLMFKYVIIQTAKDIVYGCLTKREAERWCNTRDFEDICRYAKSDPVVVREILLNRPRKFLQAAVILNNQERTITTKNRRRNLDEK
jgi:prephenate dehydrogenase